MYIYIYMLNDIGHSTVSEFVKFHANYRPIFFLPSHMLSNYDIPILPLDKITIALLIHMSSEMFPASFFLGSRFVAPTALAEVDQC